jgi:hypothetical protein
VEGGTGSLECWGTTVGVIDAILVESGVVSAEEGVRGAGRMAHQRLAERPAEAEAAGPGVEEVWS